MLNNYFSSVHVATWIVVFVLFYLFLRFYWFRRPDDSVLTDADREIALFSSEALVKKINIRKWLLWVVVLLPLLEVTFLIVRSYLYKGL